MTKQDIFVIYVQTLVVVLSCMKESILQRGFVWSDVFITNLLSSCSAIVGLANVHAKKLGKLYRQVLFLHWTGC